MPILPDIPATSGVTTADLIARVRQIVGEQSEDFYDDDLDVLPALNEGRLIMFSQLDAIIRPFAQATVIGSPYVTGCQDVARWIALAYEGETIAWADNIEYAALPALAGVPDTYFDGFLDAAGDRVLVVYPTPNAVGQVTGSYYSYPPELSAEQGPAWHKPFHFLPCYWAASVILDKDNLPEEALMNRSKFEAGIVEYRHYLGRSLPPHDATFGVEQKGEM